MTSVVLFTLALALQAPPQTTPTPTPKPMQTPVTQAAAPQGASATARPGSLVLTVTSEKGDLLPAPSSPSMARSIAAARPASMAPSPCKTCRPARIAAASRATGS